MTQPWLRSARVSGAVARLRLLERIRLSPEDYSVPEMRRLTRALLADGIRIFVFSFHSPSVMPGGTPYVRSDAGSIVSSRNAVITSISLCANFAGPL